MTTMLIDLVKDVKNTWGSVKTLEVFAVGTMCFIAGGLVSAMCIPNNPENIDSIAGGLVSAMCIPNNPENIDSIEEEIQNEEN